MYTKFASSLIMHLLLLPSICLAVQLVDRHDQGIVDDSMAQQIKRPRSISTTIQEIITTSDPNEIEVLNLSSNTIGDEGAEKLNSRLLPKLSNLRVLDLSHNVIEEKGLTALIPSLLRLSKLEFVNIYGNDCIGLGGSLEGFFRALKEAVTQAYATDSPTEKFNSLSERIIFISPSGILSERTPSYTTATQLVSKELLSPNWLQSHKRYYELFPPQY